MGLFPPPVFQSRELKIVPLGWGSGVSSEGGICANMGLGAGLLPREGGGGVGSRAGEPRPPGKMLPPGLTPCIARQASAGLLPSLASRAHVGTSLHRIPQGSRARPRLHGGPGDGDLCLLVQVLSLSPPRHAVPAKEPSGSSLLKPQLQTCFSSCSDNCSHH